MARSRRCGAGRVYGGRIGAWRGCTRAVDVEARAYGAGGGARLWLRRGSDEDAVGFPFSEHFAQRASN
ncbi:hypothetical protein ES319_A09G091200v1 [Gossypium barbadense]|uniref:Uncharacterized protein n=1 Tax=Gossypium barbadense TaxID=3634 RepID=A0A5J5UC86_GOSBA|nr:hypothetical protein ES319_A09G091200v1 [Gossypium barbadense]